VVDHVPSSSYNLFYFLLLYFLGKISGQEKSKGLNEYFEACGVINLIKKET